MHRLSNLQRHSTTVRRILALNLGKFNSVLCVYDPATHAHHFEPVQTTPRTVAAGSTVSVYRSAALPAFVTVRTAVEAVLRTSSRRAS